MSILNENIRFFRQKEGFKSARLFAEHLGVKPATVSEYESRRQPNRDFLAKIAHSFNIDLNLFISEKLTDENYNRLCAEKKSRTESEPLKGYKTDDKFFEIAAQLELEEDPGKRKELSKTLTSLNLKKLGRIDELKDEILLQMKEKEELFRRL